MTGSAALAKQAYEISNNKTYYAPPPDSGFTHIGAGGTRVVYKGPDGVAYKVGDPDCNLREARASRALRGNRKLANLGIHIPRARTYRVGGDYFVCAMDYIPSAAQVACQSYYDYDDDGKWRGDKCNCGVRGKKRLCFGKVLHYLDKFGIEDMFSGNIIYSTDNRFYVIDLGFQGWEA